MKQKIYILGLFAILVLVAGTLFKVNHFPGAGILLTVGIISLVLIFLPLALINSYRSEENSKNKLLYIVTWITAIVVFMSMLLKVMHWPYAGIILMIALPFPYVVFLPVYLYVTSKIKNFNIYNTVFIMMMMAGLSGFSALLALTVTRDRINESLSLSIHYNKVEKMLTQLPQVVPASSFTSKNKAIIKKADEVLALVDEAQGLLITDGGFTKVVWQTNPFICGILDSRNASGILFKEDGPQIANKLEISVKSFLDELDKTPGFSNVATLAPQLLGFRDPSERTLPWAERLFAGNYRSWVMIDLDAFRLNVNLLKREISSI